jgi:hypothetical protein
MDTVRREKHGKHLGMPQNGLDRQNHEYVQSKEGKRDTAKEAEDKKCRSKVRKILNYVKTIK